ncbi:uncharacterized protein [Leuresthes tenuis]|uniref:uncharacterized protein isoform X2 n=1 Tax=Leuresthes tenuis TaxID=355514 RepID=UPI003B50FA70
MTAKHRKGKSNHKQDDNFFKNEVMETEVRAGGSNYTLLLVLNAIILIGGATCAWFCFQQHQTLTYLTDNLMGIQMKIIKLQSFHEEMRQSKSQPMSESMETRLTALEESYALTQKQVGIALGAAEQLKTSDLPTQVLSLHTEMKARLAEMQQATVSVEQLSQLQSMLRGKSEEFEDVRIQVEGLATQNAELFQKVEAVTGSLGEAESKLGEKNDQIATLNAILNGQATEVLRLKDQLDKYQSRLEASILEMATVREFLENEQSQQLQQANVEEQLNTLVGETQPPPEPLEQMEETAAASGKEDAEESAATGEEAAATEVEETETAASAVEATEEEQSLSAGEEQGASSPGEGGTQADEQEEAPVEQEDSETEETVPEEEGETQQEEPVAVSEKEDVDATQTEEEAQTVEEENREDDDEEVQEESAPEEDSQGAADEDIEAEGDEEDDAEDVMEELHEGEEEGEEEQQDVAAEEEEEEDSLEDDALPENK